MCGGQLTLLDDPRQFEFEKVNCTYFLLCIEQPVTFVVPLYRGYLDFPCPQVRDYLLLSLQLEASS